MKISSKYILVTAKKQSAGGQNINFTVLGRDLVQEAAVISVIFAFLQVLLLFLAAVVLLTLKTQVMELATQR
ncbi:hypothetical protein D9M72_465220 [compost metagenome]